MSKHWDFGNEAFVSDEYGETHKVTLIAVRTPDESLYREWLVEFFDGSRQWEPEYRLRPNRGLDE